MKNHAPPKNTIQVIDVKDENETIISHVHNEEVSQEVNKLHKDTILNNTSMAHDHVNGTEEAPKIVQKSLFEKNTTNLKDDLTVRIHLNF